jgi:hypothetical protein
MWLPRKDKFPAGAGLLRDEDDAATARGSSCGGAKGAVEKGHVFGDGARAVGGVASDGGGAPAGMGTNIEPLAAAVSSDRTRAATVPALWDDGDAAMA